MTPDDIPAARELLNEYREAVGGELCFKTVEAEVATRGAALKLELRLRAARP